jgi:hypothetical protein
MYLTKLVSKRILILRSLCKQNWPAITKNKKQRKENRKCGFARPAEVLDKTRRIFREDNFFPSLGKLDKLYRTKFQGHIFPFLNINVNETNRIKIKK